MSENYHKKIMTGIILMLLLVLIFLLLKPILMSIIVGLILAFIFSPVYNLFLRFFKNRNFSAIIVCALLIFLILIPLWFLMPLVINQSFKVYLALQQMDITTSLQTLFPSLITSEQFSTEIPAMFQSFITNMANSLVNYLSSFILNFPTLILQLLVVFFTMFFALRDKKELVGYIRTLLPFSKEVEDKLFESSKGITASVLYGQVVVGILQGVIAGIGFFLAGVSNALLLTLLAALAGVFPIIGTLFVWAPVMAYLFLTGHTGSALIVLAFGIVSSNIDNILRPMIVARRAKIHSGIVVISMIGGVFLFGILGFILGPLLFAYLLIILDLYRNKNISGLIVQKPKKS